MIDDALLALQPSRLQSAPSRRGLFGLAAGSLAALGLAIDGDAARQRNRRKHQKHKKNQKHKQRRKNRVQEPQLAFKFVTAWGTRGTGSGQFRDPQGLALDSHGNLYVVDENNCRVQKFTSDGEFLTAWGIAGTGDGQFISPGFIAIDPDDVVYVVDTGNNRVQKFTSEGTFQSVLPKTGPGNPTFSLPVGIATDSTRNVYVVDQQEQPLVLKFASDGTFLTSWETLVIADGIASDGNDFVYVTSSNKDQSAVQKFDSAGNAVARFSPNLNIPYGVAIDASGTIYVTDDGGFSVAVFSNAGALLAEFGTQSDGDFELNQPSGIAVDTAGNIYVASSSDNLIKKFAPA
jgi:tripartite motif-containing protein 71